MKSLHEITLVALAAMALTVATPALAVEGGGELICKECDPDPCKDCGPIDEDPGKVKGNNGWGNGDQPAPGNSRYNNNAENSDKFSTPPPGIVKQADRRGLTFFPDPD